MKILTNLRLLMVINLAISLSFFTACGSEETSEIVEQVEEEQEEEEKEKEEEQSTEVDISVLASLFYYDASLSVVVTDTEVIITSSNEPDHKSMYFDRSDPRYEAYNEPNNPEFKQNPNSIETQNLVFTLPRFPKEATNKEATDFGPMGVSVNSVAFYNQNAAPGDDILDELNTFDQYEGHPQNQGQYHYHLEPTWLTETLGDDAFMGLLLDGFPVYGPVENDVRLTNADLDDYHGHSSATAEFPNGIYHYHITDDLPWINGDGYYGEAGTLTQ